MIRLWKSFNEQPSLVIHQSIVLSSDDEENAPHQTARREEVAPPAGPVQEDGLDSIPEFYTDASGQRQSLRVRQRQVRVRWAPDEEAALEEALLFFRSTPWKEIKSSEWSVRLVDRSQHLLRLKARTEADKRKRDPTLRWGGWLYYLPKAERPSARARDAFLLAGSR